MSRIRSLLQRASWLEEKAISPEAIASRNQVLADAVGLSHVETDQVAPPPGSRLIYHTDPHSPAADRFRTLRLRLQPHWSAGKLKRILITSPLPGDGKSTVASNVATALSEQGKRAVILVEADLHHSTLAKNLGLPVRLGLAECLDGGRNPLEYVRHLDPLGWYVIPGGELSSNAADLLQGQRLASVMDQLAGHFDWIVIDSPPVIALSEVLSLRNHSDGSLLVVRAGRTSRDAVEDAVAIVGKQHVLGVILNGIEQSDLAYHKYGYGDYYEGRTPGGK